MKKKSLNNPGTYGNFLNLIFLSTCTRQSDLNNQGEIEKIIGVTKHEKMTVSLSNNEKYTIT